MKHLIKSLKFIPVLLACTIMLPACDFVEGIQADIEEKKQKTNFLALIEESCARRENAYFRFTNAEVTLRIPCTYASRVASLPKQGEVYPEDYPAEDNNKPYTIVIDALSISLYEVEIFPNNRNESSPWIKKNATGEETVLYRRRIRHLLISDFPDVVTDRLSTQSTTPYAKYGGPYYWRDKHYKIRYRARASASGFSDLRELESQIDQYMDSIIVK